MDITNKEIRARARYLLDEDIFGKDWLKSVLISLLMALIVFATGGVFYILSVTYIVPLMATYLLPISDLLFAVSVVLLLIINILALNVFIGPLSVSLASVHLDLERGSGKIQIRKFFDGFKTFAEDFQLGMMYTLHIILWSLLFFAPGFYMAYSYALIFYVKHDNPEFTWHQCFDESERLMDGNRWRLFKLHMSFVGWMFLGLLAGFGIGSLWVEPYRNLSVAIFYEELKEERAEYDF